MIVTKLGSCAGKGFVSVFLFAMALAAYGDEGASAEKDSKKVGTGPYVFERVHDVNNMSKKDIVSHAGAFVAERFVSAKSVIQLKDPELGKIVGDVVLMNADAGFLDAFKGIKSRLTLDAKDNKYRLRVSDVKGIDGTGKVSPWGDIEGANRYRLEPLANSILEGFDKELLAYLQKAKADSNF